MNRHFSLPLGISLTFAVLAGAVTNAGAGDSKEPIVVPSTQAETSFAPAYPPLPL